jgi:anti-anti-sigma factor
MSLQTTFAEDQGGEVLRASLNGSLDGLTAPTLDGELTARIHAGIRLLLLDMKHLDYISSAGLRVVFKAAKAVRATGGSVGLANRQPQIVKVFEIIKALPDLRVFQNDEEMDDYLRTMQDKSRQGQ